MILLHPAQELLQYLRRAGLMRDYGIYCIYNNDLKDISDIVLQMTQDLRNTGNILDNAVSVHARRR